MPKQKKSKGLSFTKTNVAKLKPCPVGQSQLYHDTKRDGALRIKVTSQAVSWLHQATRKVNLGSIHELTIEEAYRKSDELRTLAKKGVANPIDKALFQKSIIDCLEARCLEAQQTDTLRPATVEDYLGMVSQARKHNFPIASIPVEQLTEEHVLDWYDARAKKSIARASKEATVFKYQYNLLQASKQLPRELPNPFQILNDTKKIQKTQSGKRPLDAVDLPSMLDCLSRLFMRFPEETFALTFLLHSGLRPDSLWRLNKSDFDAENGLITIRQHKTSSAGRIKKSEGEIAKIPVSSYLADVLRHKKTNADGFYCEWFHTQYYSRALEKILGRRFRLKDCRSTHATIAIGTLDIPEWKLCALQLRTMKDTLHKHYVQADKEKVRDAADKISNHIRKQSTFPDFYLHYLKLLQDGMPEPLMVEHSGPTKANAEKLDWKRKQMQQAS